MTDEQWIDEFGRSSFLDVADHDYIAARLAMMAELYPQALWGAQQAIEKYLKFMLLRYRVSSSKYKNHLLEPLVERLRDRTPVRVQLSAAAQKFFDTIERFGRFRYAEVPYHLEGYPVLSLDLTVCEIRRYCAATGLLGQPPVEVMLPDVTRAGNYIQRFVPIPGGELEKILGNRKHPARAGLIRQNLYFGSRRRKVVRHRWTLRAVNTPLSLRPELIDKVVELAYLPGAVEGAYRARSKG